LRGKMNAEIVKAPGREQGVQGNREGEPLSVPQAGKSLAELAGDEIRSSSIDLHVAQVLLAVFRFISERVGCGRLCGEIDCQRAREADEKYRESARAAARQRRARLPLHSLRVPTRIFTSASGRRAECEIVAS